MMFGIKFLKAFLFIAWIATARAGNLALRQSSFSSSEDGTTVAGNAVDGNPNQNNPHIILRTVREDKPYWIVDLGRTYIVDEIYFIGRSDCCSDRIIGCEIRVGNEFGNGGASNPKCAVISSISSPFQLTLKCSPALRGRYVSFNLPGVNKFLEIAEVLVNRNPTANIALQKTTIQSSSGSTHGQSSKAVDGNSDGNYHRSFSCTHTYNENSPWWRVDLGSSKPVSEVFIVNRAGLRERLTNIEILVGDSTASNSTVNPRCGGMYTMATLNKKSFYCQPRKTGRFVNVRLVSMGSPLYLTLCEVEVYSESKAIIQSDQENTTLLERQPLSLTCPQVFGYPQPYVAWVRDEVVYQNTTTTSIFQNSALNENRKESVWECIVSNIHGSDFHKFYIKGAWHRMCAINQVLKSKRTVHDVIKNSGEAFDDSSMNETIWFRFKHPTTHVPMQIPESCTSSMRCSTQATGWLLGSHPGIQDGVVRRTVCFSWNGDCCRYNTSVLVRRCYGFYVYKLQKTSFDVKAGYCTETSKTFDPDVMFQQVMQQGELYYALENHVINSESDLDLTECIAVCLSHQSCQSINYDLSIRTCEMNNATRHSVMSYGDWRERHGTTHYEMVNTISTVN